MWTALHSSRWPAGRAGQGRQAGRLLEGHTVSEGSTSMTNFCCFRSCEGRHRISFLRGFWGEPGARRVRLELSGSSPSPSAAYLERDLHGGQAVRWCSWKGLRRVGLGWVRKMADRAVDGKSGGSGSPRGGRQKAKKDLLVTYDRFLVCEGERWTKRKRGW